MNFLIAFPFPLVGPSLVAIRLVDLFPPQIPEGVPPSDGGRTRLVKEFLEEQLSFGQTRYEVLARPLLLFNSQNQVSTLSCSLRAHPEINDGRVRFYAKQ